MEHVKALKQFINHMEDKGRSPSTVIAYKKDIEQLFDYFKGENSKVSDYKTQHLEIYIEKLKEEKQFTLKTISRKINSFKTFFKFLNNENIIDKDIATPVSHPTFQPKEPRILSMLEYRALRDSARNNPRLYTMIELLLQTGMRIGELSRIELKDLELKSDHSSIFIKPFASNPERRVTLNKELVEVLKTYLETNPAVERQKKYLFMTKNGNPVLIRNIRTMINGAFKKSGINDATVNDIRNTFIVYQLEHGMPLEKLAEVVGHKRLTSTEKYTNLIKNKQANSASKIVPL